MPNTLAHFAMGAPLVSRYVRAGDVKWCYLGCVVPDVPWILQRILHQILPALPIEPNTYDVKAYFVAQSSLFITLFLCLSLAVLTKKPRRVFFWLFLFSLIHLLLDGSQIKWANGSILGAPISWNMSQYGVYWPEDLTSHLLTVAGILVFTFTVKKASTPERVFHPIKFSILAQSVLYAVLWLTLPIVFISSVYASDAHFLSTLKNFEQRSGQYIELDRMPVVLSASKMELYSQSDEVLTLELSSPLSQSSGIYSISGVFVDSQTVSVHAFHVHGNMRDISSVIGLWLVLCTWITWFYRTRACVR